MKINLNTNIKNHRQGTVINIDQRFKRQVKCVGKDSRISKRGQSSRIVKKITGLFVLVGCISFLGYIFI